MKPSVVIGSVIALLVALWWGIPTFRKVRADSLVDQLCAKDGGSKVFEVVKLPANRFDQYGNVRIPSVNYKKAEDDFYFKTTQTWIEGGKGDSNELVIWRGLHEIFRSSDGKKLAEFIYYARRGGDPPSHMHPSSYRCPTNSGLERKVFVKE
jgi:hypothetical protein